MSRVCQITGKRNNVANNVSNANNKTKRVQRVNLRSKRVFVPELGRSVRLRLSAQALRTLNHKPLAVFLKENGLSLEDVA
jgi:large subunit ribosomal protein L28